LTRFQPLAKTLREGFARLASASLYADRMSTKLNTSGALSGESAVSSVGQLRAAHEALERYIDERFARVQRPGQSPSDALEHNLLEQQLTDLTARCRDLERQLELARTVADERQVVGEQSTVDRAALSESRAQNDSLRGQIATMRAAEQQLRATLAEIQCQRHGILAELHILRCRAMELAEELSREKQHAMAERKLWHSELEHWRRLLETHFVRLTSSQRVAPDARSVTGLDLAAPAADSALHAILTNLHMIEHHPSSDP
jgi:chromosome segregation ATPase